MRNKFHNFVQQLLNFYAVVSTTLFTQLIFKFLGLIFCKLLFCFTLYNSLINRKEMYFHEKQVL